MACEVEMRDGLLHICGEMTIYCAAALKEELFAAFDRGAAEHVIDLAGVCEFDTTGLQLLIMAGRTCRERNLRLSVINPSASVRETLELLHRDSVLNETSDGAAA